MLRTVEVPLWLLILVLGFAAVTFASHFLFPSVRWYLRRRMEKVVARLNKRLPRPIEPFKLARRHDTVQRLIYDPAVLAAASEHAHAEGIPEAVAVEQVGRYAREIVPSFSATMYFGLAARIANWLSSTMYHVRLGHYAEAELEAIDPDTTVIFVINHRSNMDYVLVTYLASARTALSYAVGEWARVWPLQQLIRMLGGYFIRRRSRDALYRKVLARYVQIAADNGLTQAVFPEGGLSLDGHLAPPRLGLLSYVLSGFDPKGARDVMLVPVGLNYDRVLEDRVLSAAHKAGERRFRVNIPVTCFFFFRMVWLRLFGRFFRFGYACVSFGAPLSLRAFVGQHGGIDVAEKLGDEMMQRIGAVVPVLPVPLVAGVLLRENGPIDRPGLEKGVKAAIGRLKKAGVHVHIPRGDIAYMTEVGLRNLRKRHIVTGSDQALAVAPGEAALLEFYANSVAHLFAAGDAAHAFAWEGMVAT